jgi:lysozyme
MNTEKLTSLIKQHEGYRQFRYLCTAGRNTIGYGRNLDDKGVSMPEAEELLKNDIDYYCAKLAQTVSSFNQLSDARQAVLIDIAFNCGLSGLMKFRKMLSAINNLDYALAAAEIIDSEIAENRKKQIAAMMETGEWPELGVNLCK